jgi:hypothetical protein
MSMNTLRKMHALKKFKSLTADKSEAEVYGEIKKDKNKFSDEEAEELLRELYPQNYSEDNEGEGKENVQDSEGTGNQDGANDQGASEEPEESKASSPEKIGQEPVFTLSQVEALLDKMRLEFEDKLRATPKAAGGTEYKPRTRQGIMNEYWIFRIVPVHEHVFSAEKQEMIELLKGYKRKGDLVKRAVVDQKAADAMNDQARNSMFFYFEPGKQDEFIPIEFFFKIPKNVKVVNG